MTQFQSSVKRDQFFGNAKSGLPGETCVLTYNGFGKTDDGPTAHNLDGHSLDLTPPCAYLREKLKDIIYENGLFSC